MDTTATHATRLADLAAALESLGCELELDADHEMFCFPLDDERIALVGWRPGAGCVLMTVATGIVVAPAARDAAQAVIARLNDGLDAPGFVLDLDDGALEYRCRLFAGDRGVEVDAFVATLRGAIDAVEGHGPRLAAALSVARASDAVIAAPFAGYVE